MDVSRTFLGVFCIIIFSLADGQTAYHDRVLGGFGVSLHISSASEDSCSFLPMRYPRISIRRCVGRSGISFWSFFGGGPTTGASAGNRCNRLCKRTRAYISSSANLRQIMDSSFLNFGCIHQV